MKNEKTSIGKELIRAVASSELKDAALDAVEVAIDENLADGVIKDIPIIGTIVKFAQAGHSISEALFVRKLVRFLTELQNIPSEERQKLLEEYPNDSEKQKDLGENLMLALERLDDIDKPKILARFFGAYVTSEIDYMTFTRLARSLERFNLALLPNLRWFYTHAEPQVDTPEEIIHELSLAGLTTVSLKRSGTFAGSANYIQSSLGKNFLRIGFGIDIKERSRG